MKNKEHKRQSKQTSSSQRTKAQRENRETSAKEEQVDKTHSWDQPESGTRR